MKTIALILLVIVSHFQASTQSNQLNTKDFDPSTKFKVLSYSKSTSYPSSEKDTSICDNWSLEKEEISKIIQKSRLISGQEWHHLFGHYPCTMNGIILQNSEKFKFSINSGSWFTVQSSDTTLYYGSFDKSNDQYFLDTAWKDEN